MDDWADGHGPGSGHRTPDQIPTSDSDMNEKALEAGQGNLPMPGFHDSDQHKDLDIEAMANILEKTTREPVGELGGIGKDSSVFPDGAAVLGAIVPLTLKQQADADRAKELVDELFERIPWEAFMHALSERGHLLKAKEDVKQRVERTEEYRRCHREVVQGASEKFESIKTVLSAASLFLQGMYVEEGDPETIRALVNSALCDAHLGLADINLSWERINKAGAS